MEAVIRGFNMRTGSFRQDAGRIYPESDGPCFLGFTTIVPLWRGGVLTPLISSPMGEEAARRAAQIVEEASSWQEARKGIEEAFPPPNCFPGMKY